MRDAAFQQERRGVYQGLFARPGPLRADELRRCRNDIAHWVNFWLTTYDPRLRQPMLPFVLFPRQEEFLTWIAEREAAAEPGIAEKSRDVGFTWLCCAYAIHAWLFRPGVTVGFGSRKVEYVDKRGDPKCIFDKLRMIVANLPAWMRPVGWNPRTCDKELQLRNPANGSVIVGEGGDNIGRGGRSTIYFVDEAAWLEHPNIADAALSRNTDVIIWVSTPHGPGNPYHRKRFSGNYKVFTFHWRDDPRKDDAWYAKQKELWDPVVVAQEIDIDYSASIEGILIPAKWVQAAVGLGLCYPDGTDYLPTEPVECGFDVADGGANQNVLIARRGPMVYPPVVWAGENTTRTAWRAANEADALRASTVHYDCIGVGAGIRGAWESAVDDDAEAAENAPRGDLPQRQVRFSPHAILGGAAPSKAMWPDGKRADEKFGNYRAELWWELRARFEKAYEYATQSVPHPPDEMISIPNDETLIAHLSLPLQVETINGKVRVESKDTMRQRGVASPDYADALAYAFARQQVGRILLPESVVVAGPAEAPLPSGGPVGQLLGIQAQGRILF